MRKIIALARRAVNLAGLATRLALASLLAGITLAHGAPIVVAVLEAGLFAGLPRSVLSLAIATVRIFDRDAD